MNIYDQTKEMLDRAITYIRGTADDEKLTLNKIAVNAGFSNDHFNRLFLEYTGFNAVEYARFIRLRKAAYLLRTTERDILDIALASGYSTHESFSRAFRRQYGDNPADYRERARQQPLRWADTSSDVTAGNKFHSEHPELFPVPRDAAIEFLLETNSSVFGYDAVTLDWNGSFVFTDEPKIEGEDDTAWLHRAGDYIAVDDTPHARIFFLHLRHREKLEKFMQIIKNSYVHAVFEFQTSEHELRRYVSDGAGITETPVCVYTDPAPVLPDLPSDCSARLLTVDDINAINRFFDKDITRLGPPCRAVTSILSMPDSEKTERFIGYFQDDDLLGIATLSFQEAHGMKINNSVYISTVNSDNSDWIYKYLYLFGTGFAVSNSRLPIDDVQHGDIAVKHGFSAVDAGYRRVGTAWEMNI